MFEFLAANISRAALDKTLVRKMFLMVLFRVFFRVFLNMFPFMFLRVLFRGLLGVSLRSSLGEVPNGTVGILGMNDYSVLFLTK